MGSVQSALRDTTGAVVSNTSGVLGVVAEHASLVITLIVLVGVIWLLGLLLKNTNLTKAIASKFEADAIARENRVKSLETNVASIKEDVADLRTSLDAIAEHTCKSASDCPNRVELTEEAA